MTSEKHPKGLYVLFLTEMWERFSYYGMRAILILYLTKALLIDKALASNIYGSYTGLVYLTPLLGGYISDRYWGNRKSIITGGVLMAIGQFTLFFSGLFAGNNTSSIAFLYAGLIILILGNGFFKPNISTMVGQLYPAGDRRIDSAFTIFYMGINLGAFFSPLICGGLGDTGDPSDFKWGFLAAGLGMIFGLLSFIFLKDKYIVTPDGKPVGMPPKPTSKRTEKILSRGQMIFWISTFVILFSSLFFINNIDVFQNAGSASPLVWPNVGEMASRVINGLIFSSMVVIPGMIISDKSLSRDEKGRIWVIFIITFFVIFFWGAFEQAGASLTFFAEEQTERHIFGWEMPASWFQSINPLAIVVFAPLLSIFWLKLGNKNLEPPSPLKMSIGLFLLSLGYIVIAVGIKGIDVGVKVSIVWLTMMYLLHTLGELCLSPIGLSVVAKLAPVKFASLLMGVWFLSSAAANKLAGTLSSLYPPGIGEFKTASEHGIGNLPSILQGVAAATPEQIKVLADLGIPSVYPTVLGFTITNLYDFFMIFVFMAGIASILLFFIYKKLAKMMHGVK